MFYSVILVTTFDSLLTVSVFFSVFFYDKNHQSMDWLFHHFNNMHY